MSLITNAYAATGAAAPQGGESFSSIIMLVVFVGLFYLLLWLPQSKRAKAHRQLVTALQKDDEVVTNSGILGKITKLDDDYITLAITPNVEISIQRGSVSASLPKGTLKW